mmetsp:Transcript_28066/g.71123  ORF Transcript_28066/g.71123 Transcript_28066/m.71123 type:complete len:296 (+) Transcript_28066:1092-1979(+)
MTLVVHHFRGDRVDFRLEGALGKLQLLLFLLPQLPLLLLLRRHAVGPRRVAVSHPAHVGARERFGHLGNRGLKLDIRFRDFSAQFSSLRSGVFERLLPHQKVRARSLKKHALLHDGVCLRCQLRGGAPALMISGAPSSCGSCPCLSSTPHKLPDLVEPLTRVLYKQRSFAVHVLARLEHVDGLFPLFLDQTLGRGGELRAKGGVFAALYLELRLEDVLGLPPLHLLDPVLEGLAQPRRVGTLRPLSASAVDLRLERQFRDFAFLQKRFGLCPYPVPLVGFVVQALEHLLRRLFVL